MGLGERVRYQTSFTDSARWDGFVFRPGDIVISAPAKCGTTWLQMICALEIFKSATFDTAWADSDKGGNSNRTEPFGRFLLT